MHGILISALLDSLISFAIWACANCFDKDDGMWLDLLNHIIFIFSYDISSMHVKGHDKTKK